MGTITGLHGFDNNVKTSQCPTESTNCFGATITVNSTTVKVKSCAPAVCPSGSINLGIGKGSSLCCNTDLCNAQDAPDPSTNAPNGKTCYSCDGQSCLNTVSCSGTEDRCFNATASFGGQPVAVKGCASKSICDVPNLIPTVNDVSCCSGNLCNGAQSVTQSFLFLCCSLLSFILLH
ncbi:urokinase plasminogen activator surface receptor-like [Sinocyclocheilus anshuiensis]|uniref:urokinase plasminogen activator surface receptor-like n=1 Tax=Sinocyclocheilus anshuiensis TaxID=1608454 RepID=UPI0007B945D5|nr:PREDICTED: urokinase plasminogen activator surface receptor-like [Sinocyclocheilus anshuiensis]